MNRLFAILVIGLSLALSACGAAPTASVPTATSPAAPTVAPSAEATAAPTAEATALEISDDMGHTVSLPATPRRIVSLAPSVTEMLFAIGAGPQVVGVTKYCNYPPEADALPEVGGFSADTISVETIVGLSPDLVIAGAVSQTPIAEALTKVGIPTIVIDPSSFEDVYATIEKLGYLSGNADQAGGVVTEMRQRVEKVVATVADIPAEERPAVFYEVFDEPLMSAGPNTFVGQMIDLAGASNIFADMTEDYPQVSAEAIVERNPSIIVGPNSHGDKLTPELVAARPGWAEIKAVKDGKIYLLDGDMVSRPGPRLADSLEALAKALYPEHFK